MPSSWQKVVYTPPICITIRLPFVSRYFCRSIGVGGRCDTPNVARSVFGTQRDAIPLHQPAATSPPGPLPAANERKVQHGGPEKGATPWSGGGVPRFWRDISDAAGIWCDTLCATLCRNFRGSLGNFRGSLGNFRGTSGLLLSSTVPKTSGEVRGTSGEVRGLPRSSGEPDSLPATRQICLQTLGFPQLKCKLRAWLPCPHSVTDLFLQ